MRALLVVALVSLSAAPAFAQQPAGSQGFVRSRTRADYGSGVTVRPASIPDPVVSPTATPSAPGTPAPVPTPEPTAPVPAPTPGAPAAAPEWAPTLGQVDLRNPTTESVPSTGLLVSGGLIFVGGFAGASLLGLVELNSNENSDGCQEARGGSLYVPFLGGIISSILLTTPACEQGIYTDAGGVRHLLESRGGRASEALVFLHVVTSLTQLTGGLLFLLGYLVPDTQFVDGEDGVAVLPWGGPDGGGAQMLGRF